MSRAGRRYLTRAEVLAWNPDWSDHDRTLIAAALDAIPGGDCYRPASGSYIAVEIYGPMQPRTGPAVMEAMYGNWLGVRFRVHRALVIWRGSLEWPEFGPDGTLAVNLDRSLFGEIRSREKDQFDETVFYDWQPLSTRGRAHSHGPARRDAATRVCPTCHLTLPATGLCDDC